MTTQYNTEVLWVRFVDMYKVHLEKDYAVACGLQAPEADHTEGKIRLAYSVTPLSFDSHLFKHNETLVHLLKINNKSTEEIAQIYELITTLQINTEPQWHLFTEPMWEFLCEAFPEYNSVRIFFY